MSVACIYSCIILCDKDKYTTSPTDPPPSFCSACTLSLSTRRIE